MSGYLLLFLAAQLTACLGAAVVSGQLTIKPPINGPARVTMTGASLRWCGTPFNRTETVLPNSRDHKTLKEAQDEFNGFIPLLSCTDSLQFFLCFYYFPILPPASLLAGMDSRDVMFLPCRSECELQRTSCEVYLPPQVGGWPEHLNCSGFPDDRATGMPCIKPARPSATPPPSPTQQPNSGSGSGRVPSHQNATTSTPVQPTATTATTAPPLDCKPCAKIRRNVYAKTLEKGEYSLMAVVNITSITTTEEGKVAYIAQVEESYNVSCSSQNVTKGQVILLQTDMIPGCPSCMGTVNVNDPYIVCGYSVADSEYRWDLPTDKTKRGKNGGCVFGKANLSKRGKYLEAANSARPCT